MQMYHFLTTWQFDAPVAAVWDVLGDFETFPMWWSNWKRLELRDPGQPIGVGSIFDCEVRGSLPYSLRYTLEIVELDPPYLNVHRSSGDLVGEGRWVLAEQHDGAHVEHHWDVGTTNALFNTLAAIPLVRRMLSDNHTLVMDNGYRGLVSQLHSRRP